MAENQQETPGGREKLESEYSPWYGGGIAYLGTLANSTIAEAQIKATDMVRHAAEGSRPRGTRELTLSRPTRCSKRS